MSASSAADVRLRMAPETPGAPTLQRGVSGLSIPEHTDSLDDYNDGLVDQVAKAAKKGGSDGGGKPTVRKLFLRKVVQDAYEYHGTNELGFYCLFAVVVNMVLFFHWSGTTAIFKSGVQESFARYLNFNASLQPQLLEPVMTMNDALSYTLGWQEYWLNASAAQNWPRSDDPTRNHKVVVNEYAEVIFSRVIVNLENNCNDQIGVLPCYKDDANPSLLYDNGWVDIGELNARLSTKAGTGWLAYTIIASDPYGLYGIPWGPNLENSVSYDTLDKDSTTSISFYQERLYNITRQTSMADGDTQPDRNPGIKAFLSKYAYAFAIEVVAINTLQRDGYNHKDGAIFTLQVQRSDQPNRPPDKSLWVITSTLPARESFYSLAPTDFVRLAMEIVLIFLVAINTWLEYNQMRLAFLQRGSAVKYFKVAWNWIQLFTFFMVVGWAIFYVILIILTEKKGSGTHWPLDYTLQSHQHLAGMESYSQSYSAFLYGAIVVNFLVCVRIMRYMRIHPGLRAFYQVFIIAGREMVDFAMFMVYIMLLLGCACFAFFQISGGNPEFVRFADGLSIMTRLTFGFLNYETFQNFGLGLGWGQSAVTLLFWLAILLLVLYSQNIILAIVAQAYQEAKTTVGTSEMSFLSLIFNRILWLFVYLWYRGCLILRQFTSCFGMLPATGAPGTWRGSSDSGTSAEAPTQHLAAGTSLSAESTTGFGHVNDPLHSINLYQDVLRHRVFRKSYWASSLRTRWSMWALLRVGDMKSLVAFYEDFGSLKLKTRPPWSKAEEMAKRFYRGSISCSSCLLPDLKEDDGLVDREQLTSLLNTVAEMANFVKWHPNPFRSLRVACIPALVEGLMVVYGVDVPEGATKADLAMLARSDASFIDDLPPGQDGMGEAFAHHGTQDTGMFFGGTGRRGSVRGSSKHIDTLDSSSTKPRPASFDRGQSAALEAIQLRMLQQGELLQKLLVMVEQQQQPLEQQRPPSAGSSQR